MSGKCFKLDNKYFACQKSCKERLFYSAQNAAMALSIHGYCLYSLQTIFFKTSLTRRFSFFRKIRNVPVSIFEPRTVASINLIRSVSVNYSAHTVEKLNSDGLVIDKHGNKKPVADGGWSEASNGYFGHARL